MLFPVYSPREAPHLLPGGLHLKKKERKNNGGRQRLFLKHLMCVVIDPSACLMPPVSP